MGKTVYTVVGQSTTRPEGLPEGLSVEATTSVFHREFAGFLIEDSGLYPGSLFLYQEGSATYRHLKPGAVKELRDVLTEWLNESTPSRRIIHDATDSGYSNWRWYEIAPDNFIYDLSADLARVEAERYSKGESQKGTVSFDYIESEYGIRNVVSWEV